MGRPAGATSTSTRQSASSAQSPGIAAAAGMSFASKDAVERLAQTGVKVASLENAISAVESQWQLGQIQNGAAVTQLAHIESRLKRIEGDEIDDVQTGELQSGKDAAKGMKKTQLQKLEELFERIDSIMKRLK